MSGQRQWRLDGLTAAIALLAVAALPVPAVGQAPAAKQPAKTASKPPVQVPKMVPLVPPEPKRVETRDPNRSVGDQYCEAVLEPAREARFAHQAAELKALSDQLDGRLAKIEARIVELKEWVARREDFASRTSDQLVTIYSGMRPEAASEQLAKIEESTAAAILSKLAPRVASQILNDMPSDKAARLAMILMGASRKSDPGGRS